MWFTLLLVTLCSLTTIHGYSSGAGQAVCQTNEMRPRHSGLNFNQNDPSVTINAVKNGNILDIEVQCRVAGGFKGYLIAIEKDGRQVGEFLISGHKAMGCATKNSGITHSNPTSRRSVKAKWQIPANLQGSDVEVRATVVYEYSRAGHQRNRVKL